MQLEVNASIGDLLATQHTNPSRKSQRLIARQELSELMRMGSLMFTKEHNAAVRNRYPRLTSNELSEFKSELRRMERAGEITMSEYMALTEDIAVIERRAS